MGRAALLTDIAGVYSHVLNRFDILLCNKKAV